MTHESHSVGPDYFDDGDRADAAAVAAGLVNALIAYGISLDGISLRQVCDECSVLKDAYVISLGVLRLDDAREVTAKLKDHTNEFQRLHDTTANVQVDRQAAP